MAFDDPLFEDEETRPLLHAGPERGMRGVEPEQHLRHIDPTT